MLEMISFLFPYSVLNTSPAPIQNNGNLLLGSWRFGYKQGRDTGQQGMGSDVRRQPSGRAGLCFVCPTSLRVLWS